MITTMTILIFTEDKGYQESIKKVFNSELDKKRYEIICLGKSARGFQHIEVSREPLVRAFYDDILSRSQKINAAISESHCDMILLWPGLSFLKNGFKPIPEDVSDPSYYLMLWLRLTNMAEDWPWWFDFKGCKPEYSFGKHPFKCNLKDTLRLWYKVGGQPWRIQVWFYGFLLKAMGLKLTGRK